MGIKARIAAITCVVALAVGAAFGLGLLSPGPESGPPPPSPTAESPSTTAPPTPAAPAQVGEPTRIEIPALGIDEELSGHGLKPDGAMELPDFGDVGWYDEGPRPGAAGGAVVVAHLTGPDGRDVFYDLADLEPGDEVTVHRTDGVATFVVDGVEDVPKEALPYDRIWPDTDEALLSLITCGGERDPVTLYPDNTVVYAHLASNEQKNL